MSHRHLCCTLALALLFGCGGDGAGNQGAGERPDPPAAPMPTASGLPALPSPQPSPTASEPLERWTSFGPFGGGIEAIAAAPAEGAVYAGTSAGLWRSNDGAASWRRVANYPGTAVRQIAVQEPDTVIVVGNSWDVHRKTGEKSWSTITPGVAGILPIGVGIDSQPGGSLHLVNLNLISELPVLYRSEDLGETWSSTGVLSPAGDIKNGVASITVHPTRPSTLLAGQRFGGSISRDGGQTWQALDLPPGIGAQSPLGTAAFAFDSADADRFWVGFSGGGIFETSDGGNAWTERNAGIEPSLSGNLEVVALAASPEASGRLLCATREAVYQTRDGGRTWVPSSNGLPTGGVLTLAFDPSVTDRVHAGTVAAGVAQSDDGGTSWNPSSRGLAASRIRMVTVDSSVPPSVYAGIAAAPTEPGPARLFRSGDRGRTWEALGMGSLPVGEIVALATDLEEPSTLLAILTDPRGADGPGGGILRSDDAGATWQHTGLANPLGFGGIAIQPGTGVAIAALGTLHRSVDGGHSWSEIPFDLPDDAPDQICPDVTAVVADPHDHDRFYAAGAGGVVVSEDSGETWLGPVPCTPVRDPLDESPPGPTPRRSLLAPDPATPGRIYATLGFGLRVSDDFGSTFEPVSGNLPLSSGFYLSPVGALTHDGERLYVVASGDVFRSTDDDRFELWGEGAASSVTGLAALPGDPSTVIAASAAEGVLLRDALRP